MKKESLCYIMRIAWVIAKETGRSISYGLRLAWKNFRLQTALRKRVTEFTYMKLSGEVRKAIGTLNGEYMPGGLTVAGTGRKANDGVLCYYDIAKSGWRSFRKANLVSVTM